MFDKMKWLNEAPDWKINKGSLNVTTGNKTDFWRKNFYGFIRDDGHFFYHEVEGDFSAEVVFIGNYQELYDQAGLMLRVDEENWVKTGIEFTDGNMHLSAVVTRDYSDWSVAAIDYNVQDEITIRLTRHGDCVRIQYLDKNKKWNLLRLAYLDMPEECMIGVMCCSPERAGFEVEFKKFEVYEAISRKLHD